MHDWVDVHHPQLPPIEAHASQFLYDVHKLNYDCNSITHGISILFIYFFCFKAYSIHPFGLIIFFTLLSFLSYGS